MWEWMEGRFLTGIYDRGNATGVGQAPAGYMYGNNKLIGAIRLRQVCLSMKPAMRVDEG